jgi:hypothetical protein
MSSCRSLIHRVWKTTQLTSANLQIDRINRDEVAETLAEILYLNERV